MDLMRADNRAAADRLLALRRQEAAKAARFREQYPEVHDFLKAKKGEREFYASLWYSGVLKFGRLTDRQMACVAGDAQQWAQQEDERMMQRMEALADRAQTIRDEERKWADRQAMESAAWRRHTGAYNMEGV